MMKLTIAFFGLLLAAGIGWTLRPAGDDGAAVELPVQVAYLMEIAESFDATGVIKAKTGAEVKVGSRVSGVLERIHVDVGSKVEAGELLAELDRSELLPELAGLDARIKELEAQAGYAEQYWQRISGNSFTSEADLSAAWRDLRVAAARLEQAEAEWQRLMVRMDYTRVTAPITGTIASVSTQQGETIAASFAAPTFVTIVDLERLEIQAYVDEADIGRVVIGQDIGFSVDTWPGERFTGTVSTIYPKAVINNNVVNYVVIVDIHPHPGFLLRPEMTAHVQFQVRQRDETVVIPRTAVFSEQGGYFVVVEAGTGPGGDPLWQPAPVTPGIINSTVIEISEGLEAGVRYVADARAWQAARRGNPGG